jgi:hypothetical protein
MRRRLMGQDLRCKNPKCNERLVMSRHSFCPSCRYMAQRTRAWVFPIAVALGGLIWGIVQRIFLS